MTNKIEDCDLIKISAAGVVHLQLLANPEYLAACAEDTWIADGELCKRIAKRISAGFDAHFSLITTILNTREFVNYLNTRWTEALCAPDVFLESSTTDALGLLRDAEAGVAAAEASLPERLYVGGLHYSTTELELCDVLNANNINAKIVNFR